MEAYLAHHGVKGMKWGVRRQKKKFQYNSKYDSRKRSYDIKERGARSTRKISKYMDKGATLSDARKKYDRRMLATELTAAFIIAPIAGVAIASLFDPNTRSATIGMGKVFVNKAVSVNQKLHGIGYETFPNGMRAQYYDPSKDIFKNPFARGK